MSAPRSAIVLSLAVGLAACSRTSCRGGSGSGRPGREPDPPDSSAARWAPGTTFLAEDRFFRDVAVVHGDDLIAATRDNAELVRVPKTGAPPQTLARFEKNEEIADIAVAAGNVLVLLRTPRGESRRPGPAKPSRLVAVALAGGAPVVIEPDLGTHAELGGSGGTAWSVRHDRGERSTIELRTAPAFARRGETIERTFAYSLAADAHGAAWVEAPRGFPIAYRVFVAAPGDARVTELVSSPALLPFATGQQEPFTVALDAANVYVTSVMTKDAGASGPIPNEPARILAIDRASGKDRVLLENATSSGSMAIGEQRLCVSVYSSNTIAVDRTAVLSVSKAGGGANELVKNVWNARCAAADATSFYVVSFGGRKGIARVPAE